jgi:hypothetical protein
LYAGVGALLGLELGDVLGEPLGDVLGEPLGELLGAVVLGVEVLLPPHAATASTSAKLP